MAVNNNFYATINNLVDSSMTGGIHIVDYDSFVTAGKHLADMSIDELKNGFLAKLMQKVQMTINDNPSYQGSLVDMYRGTMSYGYLEVILGTFYEMQASVFDGNTLADNTIYTDQYKTSLPTKDALYFNDSNSWQIVKTIRDTDLKGAFKSPEALNAFIATIFIDVANSLEVAKEDARLGCLARAIKVADASTGESVDENKASTHYKLVTIYNAKFNTTLTPDNALHNDAFVRWAVATINDKVKLVEKPTNKFNTKSHKTFTPASYRRLKIASLFEKAIKVSLIDAYNVEDGKLGMQYEVVPFWQNIDDRLRIVTGGEEGEETYSGPVLACLYDKRALMEFVQLEDAEAVREAARKYTNYIWQCNYEYVNVDYANFVIFTLE